MIVFLMRDWAVKHVYVMWVSWRNIIIINITKVWQIFVQNILLPVVGIGTLSVLLPVRPNLFRKTFCLISWNRLISI